MYNEIWIEIKNLFKKYKKLFIFIVSILFLLLSIKSCQNYNEYQKKISVINKEKKSFINEQQKTLSWVLQKINTKEVELQALYKQENNLETCIKWVKKSLNKEWYFKCNNSLSFNLINTANADDEYFFFWNWWRVNKDWISKSKEELLGNNFKEIVKNNWLQIDYWQWFEVKYKVKKEVVACIARRDSWLWKYLKTKNNFWNVWNNDRWDTRSYKTEKDWIEAIFKTLNNKYLRHKQSIWSLSVGGWWNSPFYATSLENWNINVLNCLWVMYNKLVSENDGFRLY
jgi:hypothetical protein